jgi:N-acetylglucosaminyl-diphospho-decaprenol L-rhamnosyltransferase
MVSPPAAARQRAATQAATVTVRPIGAVDCTAIVVTHNSAADLPGMLDTIPAAATGIRTRILVVDNDSTDNIAAAVAGRPGIELVRADGNLGYAGGINAGRRHLGPTRTVAVLNPDLRFTPGSLARLVEVASSPGVGAAVPRFLDKDNDRAFPSLRREPSILRALGDAVLGGHWPGRPAWLSEMVWDERRYDHAGPVDWGTGAVLVLASEVNTAIGEWDDERFFLYSEETDYSRRIRAAGWTIQYVPGASVTHRGGGSGTSALLTALTEVNRVRYYRKYHGWLSSAVFRAVVILAAALRAGRPANRAALRALLWRRRWAALPGGRR